MWLIYILIVAAIVIPIIIGAYSGWYVDSIGTGIIITIASWIIAFLTLLLIIGTLELAADCCDKVESRTEKIEMIALSDSQDTYGRFRFLRSGYIDEELNYYYVAQEKDEYGRECFEVKNISAKDAGVVYISDEEEPYLLQSYYVYDSEFFDSIFGEQVGKIYFYVPEGSIIEQYKVDLE